MERILERAGKPAELVQVLDQHTKHAANPDEKLAILRRIADIMRGPLQDPPGAAQRLEEVVRMDPDDGKALGTLVEIYAALEPLRGPGARPGPAGRTRRRRSGAAGRVPAAAGPAGGRPAARARTGAPHLGAAAGSDAQRHRGAGVAGAHLQQPGRLAVAGPDHGAADAAGREPGPGRRHRPAARRDLRREAPRHRRRPRWRWSSWSPRSIRATSSPTSACATTTRPTRTGRASSRSPSGSCS